jgi:hypothetical protein
MQGQTAKAEAMMDQCHARMSDKPSPGEIAYFTDMRARQILDTQNWALATRWTWPATAPVTPAKTEYDFTTAFAALQRGDAAPARAFAAQPEPADKDLRPYFQELSGLLAIADGQSDEGIRLLRAAADAEDKMPFEFGPPAIAKPTAELLGEQLLKLGRKDEARAAFERADARAPGRTLTVAGLKATGAKAP